MPTDPACDPRRPCRCCPPPPPPEVTRRAFLAGAGALSLGGFAWPALAAALRGDEEPAPPRRPLVVKPVLVYEVPRRRPQASWRSWGGVQTEADAATEMARIGGELAALEAAADFPLKVLPVAPVREAKDLGAIADLAQADALVVYAAGGWMEVFAALGRLGKDIVFFCRHRSGPVYLWYEILSPRYLRQHGDRLAVQGVDEEDVVVDSQQELLWRLRGLCGLRNAMGCKVLTVGGADGWAHPEAPKLAQERFRFGFHDVPYPELGKLIRDARADGEAVARAGRRAAAYLASPGTTLEVGKEAVENAFLLEEVLRGCLRQAGCRAVTINACMGTIMPLAETTACLALSLLNDAGWLAFCESDFVVIPAGILMNGITGRPVFLNDPTYPHDGVITLAHCTAPRRMDGRRAEPARILTHFESDYGAAPKVEMCLGQEVTNIIPDFGFERWVGLKAEIVDNPFLDICRSQIDVRFAGDSLALARTMPGFHWMTGYGDCCREIGYALRRVGIRWEMFA